MGATHVTDEERAEMVRLSVDEGRNVSQIARELGRTRQTVARELACFKPTQAAAKAHFSAQALKLAQKITAEANVDQAMEVLDRTDVLPKKRDAGEGGRSQVIVCVGMPGSPALPAPSQTEIVTVQQRQIAEKHGS